MRIVKKLGPLATVGNAVSKKYYVGRCDRKFLKKSGTLVIEC